VSESLGILRDFGLSDACEDAIVLSGRWSGLVVKNRRYLMTNPDISDLTLCWLLYA
jgi:hypothetical protein